MGSAARAAVVLVVALSAGGTAQAASTSERVTLEETLAVEGGNRTDPVGYGAGSARITATTRPRGVIEVRVVFSRPFVRPSVPNTCGQRPTTPDSPPCLFTRRPLRFEIGLADVFPVGAFAAGVLDFTGTEGSGAVTYTRPVRLGTNRFTISARIRGRGTAVVARAWDEYYGGDALPVLAVARPTP